jgi:TetR/AcrR family transcriptional regulator, regulator of biofilm formation and stress response
VRTVAAPWKFFQGPGTVTTMVEEAADQHAVEGHARRHRPSAQARRDALLRAAVEVAAERGASGVTHRAVTERAGLPLATASYFFSSIDDLVAEALRTFVADEARRLSDLAGALGGDDHTPDEMAAALAEAAMPEGPLPWTLAQFETYLQAARGEALQEPVAEALGVYEHVAAAALTAAGAPDPDGAAPAFNALADGFALHHLARPRPGDVAALRRALRLLFVGLLVEAGELDRAAALAAATPPGAR